MTRPSGLQTSLTIHAVVFAVVMAGLLAMNYQTKGSLSWSLFVLWGWGIGLAAHATVWFLWGRRSSR